MMSLNDLEHAAMSYCRRDVAIANKMTSERSVLNMKKVRVCVRGE